VKKKISVFALFIFYIFWVSEKVLPFNRGKKQVLDRKKPKYLKIGKRAKHFKKVFII